MTETSDIAFAGLLKALQRAGFTTSVNDHIEFLALFRDFSGTREQFKYYLAPIVCRNPDDQHRFYEIYDDYYSNPPLIPPPQRAPAFNTYTAHSPQKKKGRFLSLLKSFYFWLLLTILYCVTLKAIDYWKHRYRGLPPIAATAPAEADKPGDTAPKKPGPVFVAKPYPKAVTDSQELKSRIIAQGSPVDMENDVHSTIFAWLVLLGLTCLALSTSFFPQKKSRFLPEIDPDLFHGDQPPLDLPVQSKNHLIQEQPVFTRLSGNMQQLVSTGISRLDIKMTISESTKSFGFISPVYTTLERRPEYLLLIDARHPLYPKLFHYLTSILIRDAVSINYYFYQKPDAFYTHDADEPIDFYGLRERHSHSRLIVMGNGYDFIEDKSYLLQRALTDEFRYWEDRLLLTPIPALDWDEEEELLSELFPLLPADAMPAARMIECITDNHAAAHGQIYTYSSKYQAQDTPETLWEYLDDDDLFQWVCALAVYPSVRWEIMLTMGSAILRQRGALHKLNYTNLLRIARISWLHENSIPSDIRLSLLKWLSLQDEITARKTILEFLKETDGTLTSKSLAYREKMIQQYTQSFVLYAHDTIRYKTHEADARMFMSLWDKGLIPDQVTVLYLKNSERAWTTPLRSIDDPTRNVGAARFLNELLALRVISNPKIRQLCRKAAAVCFSLLLLLFLFKDSVQGWPIDRTLGLIDHDYPPATVQVSIPVNDCLKKMINGHFLRVTFINHDNNRYTQQANIENKDTLKLTFTDITMAGKDSAKESFQLLLNNDLIIHCLYKSFYSRYLLLPQGVDCDNRLLPVPSHYDPNQSVSFNLPAQIGYFHGRPAIGILVY